MQETLTQGEQPTEALTRSVMEAFTQAQLDTKATGRANLQTDK